MPRSPPWAPENAMAPLLARSAARTGDATASAATKVTKAAVSLSSEEPPVLASRIPPYNPSGSLSMRGHSGGPLPSEPGSARVDGGLHHPTEGYVGLHTMRRRL